MFELLYAIPVGMLVYALYTSCKWFLEDFVKSKDMTTSVTMVVVSVSVLFTVLDFVFK